MTTLTLNYLPKLVVITPVVQLFKFLKGTFKHIGSALIMSRQCSANQQIVPYLLKEYPMHTYASLLHELNMNAFKQHEKRMDAK